MQALRLLVLEDQPFQRLAAVSLVKALGASEVLEAADGQEALQRLRQAGAVDVVLCDLQMEGMDGIEFIRHLASEQLAAAIILTSSLEDNLVAAVETMARAHPIRVLGRVGKPIPREQLGQMLHGFLLDFGSATPAHRQHEAPIAEAELRAALSNGEFVPFFQPKVAVNHRRLKGCEALARWQHPKHGLVSPGRFLAAVEQYGLMDELTLCILAASLEAMASWIQQGLSLSVSINFTPDQFVDTNLVDELKQRVRSAGVPPERVVLEVTESGLVSNLAASLETLTRLRLAGFGLSIDDFGTGFSSLQQLATVPFTELKIDQSFIRGIDSHPKNRAIVESSLRLAADLGLSTVAEGVETEAEWQAIAAAGCEVVQGYYIARPLPLAEFCERFCRIGG